MRVKHKLLINLLPEPLLKIQNYSSRKPDVGLLPEQMSRLIRVVTDFKKKKEKRLVKL